MSPPWITKAGCPGSIKHHPSLPSTRSAWKNPKVALLNFQAFFFICPPLPIPLPSSQHVPNNIHTQIPGYGNKTFPPFQEKTMFSMKTHKVLSKTIHQQILSLRLEYLLRATCLPWGTIFSLGQPTSPKDFPTFSTLSILLPHGEIMFPLENYAPLPYFYSLGLIHLHIPHAFIISLISTSFCNVPT